MQLNSQMGLRPSLLVLSIKLQGLFQCPLLLVIPIKLQSVRPVDLTPILLNDCLTTTCRCNGVPGLFCGDESVNVECWNTNVYECYEGGSSCNAGFDYSCARCHGLDC
ncbi:hypothetical protein F5887DRAFT_498482 [Amanita rubescens]|nr:hypothetical protein F5887DRAFT_498482 [Amanita rubescens]